MDHLQTNQRVADEGENGGGENRSKVGRICILGIGGASGKGCGSGTGRRV
jgi:hypothetical protein